MRLTLHTDFAIRTLIYLALKQDRLVTISDISTQYDISKNHMMKVAQELVHHGFVISERGRNGGLRLARLPEDINLRDVIEKMEPDLNLVSCLDPVNNGCKIIGGCGVQRIMFEARDQFLSVLGKYTLADSIPNESKLKALIAID